MEENKFWLRIWQTAAVTLCVFTLTVAGCVSNERAVLARMVKNGADPMRAACAIGADARSGICAVLAVTK